MEMSKLDLSKKEKTYYIDLITERFLDNPRMLFLFNNESEQKYYKCVKKLVEYCFYLALRLDGVYISKNKKTLVLFYEKNKFKQKYSDYIRYVKVLLNIKSRNIIEVLNNEKKIKENRIKLDNYIYVWFIAQEKKYGKLDGLTEVNNMLTNYCKNKNLPILLETSNLNVLNLYKRAGFKVYNVQKIKNNVIYFFADKLTADSKNKPD